MSNVAGHFESFQDYGRYARGLWRAYRRRAAHLLAERLGPGPWRVLDLGGGSMPSLPDLLVDDRTAFWQVVDFVDKIAAKPAKLSVYRGDAAAFVTAHAGEPFDAVVCFGLLMYLKPADSAALLDGLRSVTRAGALLLSHEPHSRSAAVLDPAIERPVDAVAEAAPGWALLLKESHNHPRLWGAAARLPPSFWEGALGDTLVAAEARLGGGLDTLTLLRRA